MNGLKLRKVSQPLQASIGRQWLMNVLEAA